MKLTAKVLLIAILGQLFVLVWIYFVVLPQLDSLAPEVKILSLTFESLLKIALVFAVAIYPPTIVFVVYLIVRVVLNPIKDMNATAKQIAAGFFGAKLKIHSNDEIGELATTFNQIIQNLINSVQNTADSYREVMLREEELKANLKILEEAKAKDEALLTSIGDSVFAIDKSETIFLFNKAASQISGASVEEAKGKNFKQILNFQLTKETSTQSEGHAYSFIDQALKGEKAISSANLEIVSRSGKEIPISTSAAPILDKDQNILGVVVVFRDITHEKELDHMKDEFVSIASHELRTPMTAIRGLVSMILEKDFGEINPRLKAPLEDVASSTLRLINLVNDLLDVSRLEGDRVKLRVKEVNLAKSIEDSLHLFKPLAQEKKIDLTSEVAKKLTVLADPDKVQEILSNLIGNSLKFTDKGSIQITTVVHEKLVYIGVRDTGVGISLADQKKLFNKFQQIGSRVRGRPVGTGLGLYISRELAKKMGGELWIEKSHENQGSNFVFSLPLAP